MTVVDLPHTYLGLAEHPADLADLLLREGSGELDALPPAILMNFPEALDSDLRCFIEDGQPIQCGPGGTVVQLDEIRPGVKQGELVLVGTILRMAKFPQFPMKLPGDEIRFRVKPPTRLALVTVRIPADKRPRCRYCDNNASCPERERRARCKDGCRRCEADDKCTKRDERWLNTRCDVRFEEIPVTLDDLAIDTDLVEMRLIR